ncbi:MAG: hypothetical protein JXR96_01020 [Deltaproteobacteria bacterium]|nr:hypothetical protein [Deltaproteobacteria bacterium]
MSGSWKWGLVGLILAALLGCNGDEQPECGNGVLEQGEACDGLDFGEQTCQGLGHDGGELWCTDRCELDEGSCHDCGADDPCAGISCSDHGRCLVFDCQAYCVCDPGYVPGADKSCKQEGSCKELGEACASSLACCSGWCTTWFDGLQRCGMQDCVVDAECAPEEDLGRSFCCVENPPGYPDRPEGRTSCVPTNADESCGDRSGTCGADCTAGFISDCLPGTICASYGDEDPYGYCSPPCETDADCSGCASEHFPGSTFSCVAATESGQKYCIRDPDPCQTSSDCPGELVCTYALQADGSYAGGCGLYGGLAPGAACGEVEDFIALPWDERCAGALCLHHRCSAWCESDADCPADMVCGAISSGGQELTLCWPAGGSQTPCARDADCPAGEVCGLTNDMDGNVSMHCLPWACDPAGTDCQDAGEPCGQGLPFCASTVCGTYGYEHERLCWTGCLVNADCPESWICAGESIGAVTIGTCAPFDGSATECSSDADCPIGELCTYQATLEGIFGLCKTSGGAGQFGDDCSDYTDCDSAMCFGFSGVNMCTSPCADDADCPQGTFCTGFSYPDHPDQVLGACAPFDGSAADCESSGDCPTGEVCQYHRKIEGMVGMCTTGDPEAGGQGEACTDSPDCSSGLCFSFGCGDLCATDEQCPGGTLCGGFNYTDVAGVYSACLPWDGSGQGCSLDADCPGGEACSILSRDGGEDFVLDWVCKTMHVPGGQTGDACGGVGDDPCYNDLCVTDGFHTFCTSSCLSTADCPSGLTCSPLNWGLEVGVCGIVEGSLDACFTDADCQAADEVCSLLAEFGQDLRGACHRILGDGTAGPGEACSESEDCVSFSCRGDVCFLQCHTNEDCAAAGLDCVYYEVPDGRSLSMCQPPGEHSPYCTLCELDSDCAGEALCVDSLANPGERYCTKPCAGASDCPEGASCVDVDGATHCTPDADSCVP